MKIITTEGKVIEGHELTEQDEEILAELLADDGVMNTSGTTYTTSSDRRKIAAAMIGTYCMSRRTPLSDKTTQEVEVPSA